MLSGVHPSWRDTIVKSLDKLPPEYRKFLDTSSEYFPGKDKFLSAFSTLPKEKIKYILFGQDPYPRRKSATGYAFIDGAVEEIFSDSGLSKPVNKATSLRNFIKMLLVSSGRLDCDDMSQSAISNIDKSKMISSLDELRVNFERAGVLLLNSALVFTTKEDSKMHIEVWRSFIQSLLLQMQEPLPILILFGKHSEELLKLKETDKLASVCLEHPYNHTFVCNKKALKLFGDMGLLEKRNL